MDIRRTASIYNKVSLWIISGLTLLGLWVIQATRCQAPISALLVSAVFSLICCMAYSAGWKVVARRSPESLPKFFLAGSALRLMAAAVVLLVWCVANRHDIQGIKWFACVFIVFYLMILVFDAIFFAKVSKNSNQ